MVVRPQPAAGSHAALWLGPCPLILASASVQQQGRDEEACREIGTFVPSATAVRPFAMITHRFGLDDIIEAYHVFADPAHTGALKTILSRN